MSKPDYDRLIDAEMWAYIRRLDQYYPPQGDTMDIAEHRRAYDAMCEVFRQPRPDRVEVEDRSFGGVPCRVYRSSDAAVTVVYYHGGSYCLGGLDSHDDVCAEICDRTGYRVVSVDYPLSPETYFPDSFNAVWDAFMGVVQDNGDQIVLSGDSAGGNFAAAVAHHARGRIQDRVIGQVLIYPGLGGDRTKGSYVEHADAPHLKTADMEHTSVIRCGTATAPENDPRYAPLHDSDFTGLPTTVSITAQCDPLASDGETYRDVIRAAGGKAHWSNVAGMVHACLRARNMSSKAAGFFDEVVGAIDTLGRGEWPYE